MSYGLVLIGHLSQLFLFYFYGWHFLRYISNVKANPHYCI